MRDLERYPLHHFHNPLVTTRRTGSNNLETSRHFDGELYGITVEYTDIPYTTTGDDHWTATCEDDLDSDGNSDWVTDYTTLP